MKQERRPHRQGDIMFIPVDDIPETAKVVEEGKEVIVAHGEGSGHTHTLASSMPVSLLNSDVGEFIKIQEEANLKHQEHPWQTFKKDDAGYYKIIRESEFDPFAKKMRQVMD